MTRVFWRVTLLGATVLALALECWAAWDSNPDTDPWTDLIVAYVPWKLAVAVFGALALWLPVHFIRRYRRRGGRPPSGVG